MSKEPLDESAAAAMFLYWQQPSDRALAGWCPFSSYMAKPEYREEYPDSLLRWLAGVVAAQTRAY